jgi:hypothetical protein
VLEGAGARLKESIEKLQDSGLSQRQIGACVDSCAVRFEGSTFPIVCEGVVA